MARSSYNTRTRQLILDYLRANPSRAVSAADIVAYLEAAGAPATPPPSTAIWTSWPPTSR